MNIRDQLIVLFVFFPVLTTITVGLRIFVRTHVNRGSFGYDDVALIVTYIGLLIWVGLASAAVQYPVGSTLYTKYDSAKADVCYIISGTVKISVALVLYRLDSRRAIRAILIVDILVCSIWTIIVTLILALGCTGNDIPIPLSDSVCRATNYSQEISYVIFDVLHVVIPIVILWNVQLSRTLKWSIVALFGVGLLAAVAAVMKLIVYVKMYSDSSPAAQHALDYQTQVWAVTEHGLSLFAASILALKPVYNYISKSWTRLSLSLSGNAASAKDSSGRSTGASSRASRRKNLWSQGSTELGTIDVRNDIEVRSEDNVDQLKHPAYMVDAYNDSQRKLMEGAKLSEEV